MRFKPRATLSLLILCACGFVETVLADTEITPSTEYLNRIKVAETIQPIGESPFGENLSLFTGGLGFRQADISYPGIGPTIELTRSYAASGSPLSKFNDLAMADWDLSVPRITTLVGGDRMGLHGYWTVEGIDPQARCSNLGQPVSPFAYGMSWWHGYQLITGDGNSQSVLRRSAGNSLAPANEPSLYPIVTAGHWMVRCLPGTSNGMPGESYLAMDPEGTRYWFDRLSYGAAVETLVESLRWTNRPGMNALGSALTVGAPGSTETPDVYWGLDELFMPRKVANIAVTRVEDRFGNWLTYGYNAAGQLIEINASDLRRVVVSWRADSPLVDSITLQPGAQARTWRYEYSAPTDPLNRVLTRVVQPDQSAWTFAMNRASQFKMIDIFFDNPGCIPRELNQETHTRLSMVLTHPSGLIGSFGVAERLHGRSRVPATCSNGPEPYRESAPPVYASLALVEKTLSGPGLAPATWRYGYSKAYGSTVTDCASGLQCQETKWVQMTDPLNQVTQYLFSTKWDHTEGKLLRTVAGITVAGLDNPTGLQTNTSYYASPTQGPYPAHLGYTLEDELGQSNNAPSETLSPENLARIERQGVVFSRQTTSFDRFGQVGSVTRSSSLGSSRSDSTTYQPVYDPWVLGQVQSVVENGKLSRRVVYNASILPVQTFSFELPTSSMSYAADGTVSTLTDPRGNTTVLSQFRRGVPQRIAFADGSTVLPEIGDFGEILAVTSQIGALTRYSYDAMGRMTRLDFPVADSVSWNPSFQGFVAVPYAEFGLPAGHWRQTISTGNGRSTNYYDAQWRPVLTLTEDAANALSRSYSIRRYDALGREVFRSYPVAGLSTVDETLDGIWTTYDALGRSYQVVQSSELGPLTTTTEYLAGFKTRSTNPRGFQTTTTYQVFDLPESSRPVLIQAPEGATTTIERDSYGKALRITRSGL